MQCNKSHLNVTVLWQWQYSSIVFLANKKQNSAIALRGLVSYKLFIIVVQFVNTHLSVSVSPTKESECKLCTFVIDEGGRFSGGFDHREGLRVRQPSYARLRRDQRELDIYGEWSKIVMASSRWEVRCESERWEVRGGRQGRGRWEVRGQTWGVGGERWKVGV